MKKTKKCLSNAVKKVLVAGAMLASFYGCEVGEKEDEKNPGFEQYEPGRTETVSFSGVEDCMSMPS